MNVVILLMYRRKSIFNFTKKLLELASANLVVELEIQLAELALEIIFLIPRRMFPLGEKKKREKRSLA